MARYYLPKEMRYSSLKERRQFYRQEFRISKVDDWFKWIIGKIAFAVIIGRHTHIYPAKYKEDASTSIIIDEYASLEEVKNLIIEFLPESAYYDRNIYGSGNKITGQELAFDLDPENITCPIHGSLAEKMKMGQGLGFCELELQLVKEQALSLYEYLEKNFSVMRVVYSGRGYHIHVFDDYAYRMTRKERRQFAKRVKAKGFPIDEWVTAGDMRLIRLPYSLHGLVSRIAMPLDFGELKSFDPIKDERCVPKFLRA
ncbi:DNA primase [Candidatus Bathyarchaeota archaeon]|nr:DNA primase [Candidatus Bathyarchaeota archaeon]